MAVDADGLRELNELYALPKACTKDLGQSTADAVMKMRLLLQFCSPDPPPITNNMIRKGVVLIPEGRRALSIGKWGIILPGGRLVDYYPATTYEMARDGAVEVEQIRIAQPPNENLEGWIVTQFLGRICCSGL
jgi:hypothetical protein